LEIIKPRPYYEFPLPFDKGKGVRGKGLTQERGRNKKEGRSPSWTAELMEPSLRGIAETHSLKLVPIRILVPECALWTRLPNKASFLASLNI
jgi:hypothetical protein